MKKTLRTTSIPGGIAAGLLCALMITLCITVITSKTVQLQWIDQSHIGYAVMVMLFFSAWMGAAVSCTKIMQNKLPICILFAAAFFVLLLGLNVTFFDGHVAGAGETAILIIGGSLLAVFMKTGTRTGKKRRNRKQYNR